MGNTKNKDELIPAPKVKKNKTNKLDNSMIGILMVFVVVSIVYSTYVVYVGTTGYAPKVMLIPQAVFAAIVLIYKFVK